MKILNNDKSKTKYKAFLTVFYGLIFFVSIKQIIAFLRGHLVKTSSVVDIPFSEWTIRMWINPLISTVIIALSIVIIFLVIRKKLPRFNLIFPVYYFLFILFWSYIIPTIAWSHANTHEEILQLIDIQDKYYMVHPLIEFVFSSWFLLRLWNVIKGKKRT